MVALYQDPLGEKIFGDTTEMSRSAAGALDKSSAYRSKETQLMGRIEELEGQLRESKLNVRTSLIIKLHA